MCYLSRDTIIAEVKYLMMLIVGEGSQISINHKRENSAFSFLIGPNLRLFLEYSVFCKSIVLSKTLNTGLDTDTELAAVSKKPDMSADTPVRGQGCPQTGVSADRGVCGQVLS